jgi:molybdenum cofactor biosynthesis enzyme
MSRDGDPGPDPAPAESTWVRVAVACLTVVDMTKAVDPRSVIAAVQVETKTGGKTGEWSR